MKNVIVLLSLTFGLSAQAQIKGSDLESHQQKAITEAVTQSCGMMRDLSLLKQTEEVVQIDQGVRDIYFVTTLEGFQRMDQNIFDRYVITVKSVLADAYDHTHKVWGIFAVESVQCEQAN